MFSPSRRLLFAVTLATAFALPACAPTTALVPESLVTSIQEDGRMRTYDLAWQNTRLVVDLANRGEVGELETVALELTARLHRLDTGRAGNMADRRTVSTITALEQQAQSRTREGNRDRMQESAQNTLQAFDGGDFAGAKDHAMEVLVIARWLGEPQ